MSKVHINLPFVKAISQMSSYAKHWKEILSNNGKLENFGIVGLNEESFAILRKLLPKTKDPDKFTIPCLIEGSYFDKCLCDLGASVKLIPYFIFKKLGIIDLEPTNITLHLANRSVVYPRGEIEDELIKVD